MKSSFFVITDRGNLKAYRAEKPGGENRAPHLHQIQALSFLDALQKVSEMNTDLAGAFPAGNQGNQNSISEKHYSIEMDKRIAKRLAGSIEELLQQERPVAWSFAAPGEIKDAVLAHVAPEWRRNLAESIAHDLVNVPAQRLLEHFEEVRAV